MPFGKCGWPCRGNRSAVGNPVHLGDFTWRRGQAAADRVRVGQDQNSPELSTIQPPANVQYLTATLPGQAGHHAVVCCASLVRAQ